MKKYPVILLIILTNMLFVPVTAYTVFSHTDKQYTEAPSSENEQEISFDTICVYNPDTKETFTLGFRDYIIGVVAAEMPAQFHEEALSACAVAAATLARKKIISGTDKALDGAVISTDPAKHQAFSDNKKLKERWGDDFDIYYEKICKAVDNAIDYSITYDGKLIVSAYHAISTGVTENAENVWTEGYPYLTSVESPGDKLSPKYSSEKTVSFEEFKKIFTEKGASLPDDKALWFSSPEYTDAGTLKAIKIGGKSFSGEELRELFSLRSSAIKLSINSEGVIFDVTGYGHGVGMSQYGADYFARQGYTWQEIIKHYYKGVEIQII